MIIIKRLSFLRIPISHLIHQPFLPKYSFALMQLFQSPKKPQQLSPVFKKPQRIKGHLRYKISKKSKRYVSPKLNPKVRQLKKRLKNHKGMLKRVKIVGPLYNRRFKRLSAHRRHLRRNKTKANLKRKKLDHYIAKSDMRRVRKLIPYYKRKSLKRLY